MYYGLETSNDQIEIRNYLFGNTNYLFGNTNYLFGNAHDRFENANCVLGNVNYGLETSNDQFEKPNYPFGNTIDRLETIFYPFYRSSISDLRYLF